MEENDKQEPTLQPEPTSEAAAPEPAPDLDKPAVQDDTKVVVAEPDAEPASGITGHPTHGDYGRRMIFGFKGAGSRGAVIDHVYKPFAVEAFGVQFKGVEVNNFDALEEPRTFNTLREANDYVREFIASNKGEVSNG